MPLEDKDFQYFKRQIEKDISEHKEKIEKNRPDEIIAAYNGEFAKTTEGTMIENYLFIFVATALPGMFFQLPRINIRAKRSELDFSAAILNSLTNSEFGEKEKEENQLCIIDTLMPYGFSCMKNGYNSKTGKVPKNKVNIFTGKTSNDANENDMEGEVEFIEYEKSISLRQSPKFTYLDSTQPFGKGNRITFEYTRTFQQILDSNLYTLSSNFIEHFKARAKDSREVDIKLYESWWMMSNKVYKLVYIEGWREEIAFKETKYKNLPTSLLRFNKMGDVLYSVSHGKLGLTAQTELNYLNELWKKHLDNLRNQHLVYLKALSESGKLTLKQNDIGGIVESTQPLTAGIAMPLQSGPMDANLFGNIQNVREYLKLLLSATGGKTGGPDAKLATVERNKALGDALRSAGIQDEIRTFLISQIKQRIQNILTLGNINRVLKLSGENLINPETGKMIEPGSNIVLGGDRGFSLKKLILGNIDIDYAYDVDVTSAQKPDFPVIRQQLGEGMVLGTKFEPLLMKYNKKFRIDLALEDYFATFDAIPDAKKYIQEMSPEERQDVIQNIIAQTGMPGSGQGVPTEESIARSAEMIPPTTKGLGV